MVGLLSFLVENKKPNEIIDWMDGHPAVPFQHLSWSSVYLLNTSAGLFKKECAKLYSDPSWRRWRRDATKEPVFKGAGLCEPPTFTLSFTPHNNPISATSQRQDE